MNKINKETTQDEGPDVGTGVSHTLHSVGSLKPVTQAQGDLFDNENGEVDFRGVSWQGAAILVTKLQIGLGVLSLPSTFHVLGFFPGILCFLILALICTVAGYVCGNARQYYPHMHSIGDAAELLFGKAAREIVGVIYYIYVALVAGAGMLAVSVALNAISSHATCTMIFLAVACLFSLVVGTGFRSLEKVSWISWVGVVGIIASVWVTAIACLTQDRPAAAVPDQPVNLDIRVFPNTTFIKAMSAIANQLFAVGGSGIFFTISAEMKHPHLFTRSLLCGQSFIILTNVVIASIVYGKVGQYIASPALGSAGPLIKKVSYGIALPGLLVTAVLYSHTAAKYSFVRILRGTRHLQSNTMVHWAVWIGSMTVTVVFGFIIVGVVPFFDDFLSLVGALFNPVFTNIIPGCMLLFFIGRKPVKAFEGSLSSTMDTSTSANHWSVDAFRAAKCGWKNAIGFAFAWFMIITGGLIIVGGTYATTLSIKSAYRDGEISGVFSCGDNS
ncbi:Amino acid transporter, transmembrane [Penicillium camemberti]|uniref:Amino acid transporter, transmembrane n=1 Tax=Penicillium camemberti (strain FM 013) TaxID=1429867 RepID=A0A0G4P0Z5_PENC3|nr:Amino acid transporter, transmembrane [Penicillium camemberti]